MIWAFTSAAVKPVAENVGSPGCVARAALIAVNYRSTELTEPAQPKARLCLSLSPLDPRHTESMARIDDRFEVRRFEDGVVYQRPAA